MISKSQSSASFNVRVLRQDAPGEKGYWERHQVEYEPDMNVISVLQKIAARPVTADGKQTTPVAWDCNCLEEVCGACSMLINGHVRQACSALVDRLLEDDAEQIELRPMTKFPVLRDLFVDRGRLFEALKRQHCWIDVDGYFDMGSGPRVSPEQQQEMYRYSECMSCGCCLEACPQYLKIELTQRDGETDEQFEARQKDAYNHGYLGAHAINQTDLFNMNPTGAFRADERLEALTGPGGIQICGNSGNCTVVCPKKIPNHTAIAKMGRATTWHKVRKWFEK